MHKIKNSLFALGSLAALAIVTPLLVPLVGLGSNATVGNAAANQTQNVNVVNAPTVNLAAGTGVSINGTPTVNVAAPQTVLIYDETRPAPEPNGAAFPPFDTSAYKEIRVIATADHPFTLIPSLVAPGGEHLIFENIVPPNTQIATTTYELPGPTMEFHGSASTGFATTIRVLVYGRTN